MIGGAEITLDLALLSADRSSFEPFDSLYRLSSNSRSFDSGRIRSMRLELRFCVGEGLDTLCTLRVLNKAK